jgi:hypothetical protein
MRNTSLHKGYNDLILRGRLRIWRHTLSQSKNRQTSVALYMPMYVVGKSTYCNRTEPDVTCVDAILASPLTVPTMNNDLK